MRNKQFGASISILTAESRGGFHRHNDPDGDLDADRVRFQDWISFTAPIADCSSRCPRGNWMGLSSSNSVLIADLVDFSVHEIDLEQVFRGSDDAD